MRNSLVPINYEKYDIRKNGTFEKIRCTEDFQKKYENGEKIDSWEEFGGTWKFWKIMRSGKKRDIRKILRHS